MKTTIFGSCRQPAMTIQALSPGRSGSNRVAATLCMFLGVFAVLNCAAQNSYLQHNLVSDLAGMADHTDTNLVNPWGIALSGTSPFWISDNHSGLSTLYNSNGTPQSLIVTIPPPSGGTPPAAPTGIVFNGTTNFNVSTGAVARFIFSTEDGTIAAWNTGSNAVLKVDNSAHSAIYKGLAIGSSGGTNYLYAADFHNGKVDVFDGNFLPALAGSFLDPTIPAKYAPFGIQNIGGLIYVTYAMQDADAHDDVPGLGNGYVNVFTANGVLVRRLISQGELNSPWGIVQAPLGFGPFSGALLVGNFGDGMINAFDPTTGFWEGALSDTNGAPIVNKGLWAIVFGNGGNGGDSHKLYFTAGIPGSGTVEDHGLLGSLAAVYPGLTTGLDYLQHNLVSDLAGMADHTDTNLLNPWGIALSSNSPFWVSDNHSGLSTLYNSSGTPQSTIVSIPPPNGGTPPAAPTGMVFNNTTSFIVATGAVARFIFSTEDGTISAWNAGPGAVLKVDNSTHSAVYKGLAIGGSGGSNYLYAADFHNGKVDVFDGNFLPALAGSFADPTIPAKYAPFGIQNVGGLIYVTYALQDANAHDDAAGPGNGYVNVFTASGQLVQRFASRGVLNSPWGMVVAPSGFGAFSGSLLIGNFGDGRINAFDPASKVWLGRVLDTNGAPLVIEGLWGLIFGNGGNGGDPRTVYFTAGIPGPGGLEDHGLFGSLSAVAPVFTSISNSVSGLSLNWAGGTGPFQVLLKTNLTDTNWTSLLTTSNHNATVPQQGSRGFFRLLNQGD
jgi:uncharacterized protein (TIGR03118 family)